MIYLLLALSLLLVASIVIIIIKLKKRRNVQYSLYSYMRSNSIKDNIYNIQKISSAHQLASSKHSPTWTYRLIIKKWKRFRKNYVKLYSLQGRYDDLVPSCKWITDNYYLINQNIKQVSKNFNKKNCRNLPAITIDSSDYLPRIYVLAKELMAMMDKNFSESLMLSYTEAYQVKSPLRISELWALPIMLNICLLDDIAVITEQINRIIKEKKTADIFVNEIPVKISRVTPVENIISAVSGISSSEPLSFSSQILLRLRERGFGNAADLSKVVQALPCDESSYSSLINHEAIQQAGIETRISNLISSLIKLNEVNWERVVSTLSLIDITLSIEENGIFKGMTFKTKETYRYEIENIAARSSKSEKEVAEKLIQLTYDKSGKEAHAGYYLIGKGKSMLMDILNVKHSFLDRVKSHLVINRGKLYFTVLFFFVFIFALLGSLYTFKTSKTMVPLRTTLTFILLIIPGFAFLSDIINQVLLNLVAVRNPPAMDFEDGVPIDFSTVIVVPVIFESVESIDKYIDKLEQLYLVSKDPNIFYAILGDFMDSKNETSPNDIEIENYAKQKMEELTQKYFRDKIGRFSMFCRYRQWNECQGVWMGWERKRGKLEEFNAYMLGNDDTSFYNIYGDNEFLSSIKYVITIDADTQLIRSNAYDMIGIMAHPLNRPVIDEITGKVTEGFGLMQPRVSTRYDSPGTVFSRLFSANSGFDPYTTFVSDVYQDVFYEGIFIGKGIYDPEVFHKVLRGKIPENSVLSHDLLEGSFVKCAFASGVQVFDGMPPDILSFFKRQHRWIRGDWQLLPWIAGRDKLKFLPRWQMFSNLLRSLEPISVILYILLAVFWLQWPLLLWLLILLIPTIISLPIQMNRFILHIAANISIIYAINEYTSSVLKILSQNLLLFITLPFRAYISADAIIRTIYRLCISKHNLLEWQTQSSIEKNMKYSLGSYTLRMLPSIITGATMIVVSCLTGLIAPLTVGILWLLSPLFSYLAGKKPKSSDLRLTPTQKMELMEMARTEFRFFDEMMLEHFNYLIPDNFQTVAEDIYATRTSPTNIGLQLMAFITARDLGFISLYELFDKVSKTIETIKKMPKWNGHLYNWYDISTLEPLQPKYISSVDSGNLIGFMICVKQALVDILDKPVFSEEQFRGIEFTMIESGSREYKIEHNEPEIEKTLEQLVFNLENPAGPWIKEDFREPAVNNLLGFINDLQDFPLVGKSVNEMADEGVMAAINYRDAILDFTIWMKDFIDKTHFSHLYDLNRHLFHIGYNTHLNKYDDSHYDFIASESRLTGYLAIAKGDIPQKHWYHLSRPITLSGGCPVLLSWGGTMFEYFMPHLIMKSVPGTVFDSTLSKVLKIQMKFGSSHDIPWGVSESAYYRFDQNLNYQYRAFGIPSLGVKSDLSKFLVISPYSSLISGWKNPEALIENLRRLKENGVFGKYGFFESIDFMAPADLEYKKPKIIKTYMCHHKGMSLAALDNILKDNIHISRFHREPMVKSSEILLEEKRQLGIVVKDMPKKLDRQNLGTEDLSTPVPRIVEGPARKTPVVHVISNDRLQTFLSSNGTGYLKFKHKHLNPWTSDPCNDVNGCFIYIKDTQTGRYFSISNSPVHSEPTTYQVVFSAHKVEFKRVENMIDCHMEITVSPQFDVEIRRITLTNLRPEHPAELEVISFMELCLENKVAYDQHPAFHKLFVETEFNGSSRSVIATKRPRSLDDETIYFGATCLVESNPFQMFEYETERDRFIGRGRTLKNPEFLDRTFTVLRGTGEVVDPCISLKCKLSLPPFQSASVSIINAVAEQKSDLTDMLGSMRIKHAVLDVFKNALFDSKVEMQYFKLNYEKTNRILDLLSVILYSESNNTVSDQEKLKNHLDQRDLWKFGISGDNPIILLKVESMAALDSVRDVITAYEYLKRNQVELDLVILNEKDEGYFTEFSDSLHYIASSVKIFETGGSSQGVFVIRKCDITEEENLLLNITARVTLTGEDRILGDRISGSLYENQKISMPLQSLSKTDIPANPLPDIDFQLFNGFGGFTSNGHEYVIELNDWNMTPAPWSNIIANENFGCICTEAGPGYTYHINSRENKLTQWNNDPLLNELPETIYFRDDADGTVFCPTTQPLRQIGPYRITHGFGFTKYQHESCGIYQELSIFVPRRAALKYTLVHLENKSADVRNLSAFYYVDLVLGLYREMEMPYIVTGYDQNLQAITAQNIYSKHYKGYTAYLYSELPVTSYTCDKNNFFGFGCHGTVPAAIEEGKLDNEYGNVSNPCAVIHTSLSLEPGESKTFCFIFGQETNESRIEGTINEYGSTVKAFEELKESEDFWNTELGFLQVKTPDEKMNYLLNGWLQYQTLSCRLFARSSFYQSGGAYGFRDQLQDSLAFIYTDPSITRNLIKKASERQFPEGDVQHWWHEDTGIGVRTTISDDLLWLPYVLSEYIRASDDFNILNETTNYIEMPLLQKGEHEKYGKPDKSEKSDSIYNHAKKAIIRSMDSGEHGLPLIGSGDWNDAMNRVGTAGSGESVWLAFFIHDVISRFIEIAEYSDDKGFITTLREYLVSLRESIDRHCWDGQWFLRAFFDDGSPLGSRNNRECRIDAISQSWSVISGAADSSKAYSAMNELLKYLVDDNEKMVLLLYPPFYRSRPNPGYIQGYLRGIRENGGQYTHGAIWAVAAAAMLGMNNEAYMLYDYINPINHTMDESWVSKYRLEPYVMSADIYYNKMQKGRGGWSWYTGSASWMYRVGIQYLLGFDKRGNKLYINPTMPSLWYKYSFVYEYGKTKYQISVEKKISDTIKGKIIVLDEMTCKTDYIPLIDDGKVHKAWVVI